MAYEPYPWFKGSFALRAGVLLIAETALLSFFSVIGLLTVVVIRTIKRWKRRRAGTPLRTDEPLQPVALLFILAMCMELIQSFANILSARWAFQGATTEGRYCTAQAVLKQLGNDGAALFTMFLGIMVAVQALWPAAMLGNGGRKARRLVWGMVCFVVLFWLLVITVPATTISHYYGSTGPWCWIPTKLADGEVIPRNEYLGIATEYGWFWLASFTCFICYGYIVIRWWIEADRDPELIHQALVMIWYPIAYFVEIFPQSMVRVLNMHAAMVREPAPPPGWTIFTSVLFASSGWVNVLLWVVTGRQYGFSAAPDPSSEDEDGARGQYALHPGAEFSGGAAMEEVDHAHGHQPPVIRVASDAHSFGENDAFPAYIPPPSLSSGSRDGSRVGRAPPPDADNAYRAPLLSPATSAATSPTDSRGHTAFYGGGHPYDAGAYQPGAYVNRNDGW
ncbi:hypothetical protein DL93DRAFT_1652724 [Clavulina sp. PMI_390]|nr:hypothetical protein DL93DRAFT_1652724 [Clavulina sp. PMI_390]